MDPTQGRVPATTIDVHVDRRTVLPGRVWCAENPRGLVAICHGLGEHSGRYAALASDLAAARFSVVCLDLPGHGQTNGPRGDMPSWIAVRDHAVPAMFTALRGIPGQPAELPHVLLGNSMGGLLALDYGLAHPGTLHGVVVSGAAIKNAMPPWWKLALANVARVTTPAAPFPHGLDEGGVSRDPEVLRSRKADPLMGYVISPRLYFAMQEAQSRVMREARQLAVPTLLLHGAADRLTDPKGSLEFNAAAPHGKSRLITYKDAYHDLFTDTIRDQVVKDVAGWLELVAVM